LKGETASTSGPDDVPVVTGRNLRMDYRGRTVLSVDSISISAGVTYALLGASGAGKSTLLRVLGLLERPTSGVVLFEGAEVPRGDLSIRRRIAAVFQKPYLLRGTVEDNVAYGMRLRGVARVAAAEKVRAALERVGLSGWESRSALTLSGGEAQRVALARALVLEPQLLLLDEPLSYMDPLLKRQLTLEFAEILAGEHVTTLYVTHDQEEAAVVADVVGVMREGRIVEEGTPEVVLTMPGDAWVASFVGTESPIVGVVVENGDGVVGIDCAGAKLYAAGDFALGTRVAAGVRPEDVLLFESGVELPKTSARNQLEATIVQIAPDGAMVRAVAESGGVRVASTVSRLSAASLGLEVGKPVKVVFKASAMRVRASRGKPYAAP
jgi:molybdopterin-binding protein